jgi:hypothetical protein
MKELFRNIKTIRRKRWKRKRWKRKAYKKIFLTPDTNGRYSI